MRCLEQMGGGRNGASRPSWRAAMLTSAAMLAASGGLAHAQTAPAQPAAPAAESSSTEEVVVTAEKRPARALDVAGSLTVVGARQLQVRGIQSLVDLTNAVPGLDVSSRGAVGFNQIILRGITSGGQQTSPTVGIYAGRKAPSMAPVRWAA